MGPCLVGQCNLARDNGRMFVVLPQWSVRWEPLEWRKPCSWSGSQKNCCLFVAEDLQNLPIKLLGLLEVGTQIYKYSLAVFQQGRSDSPTKRLCVTTLRRKINTVKNNPPMYTYTGDRMTGLCVTSMTGLANRWNSANNQEPPNRDNWAVCSNSSFG